MKRLTLYFTLILVLAACEKSSDCIKPLACNLEPDPGYCEAYIPRYYFDRAEGTCKEFIWGGCDGVVPFETLQACKECVCTEEE